MKELQKMINDMDGENKMDIFTLCMNMIELEIVLNNNLNDKEKVIEKISNIIYNAFCLLKKHHFKIDEKDETNIERYKNNIKEFNKKREFKEYYLKRGRYILFNISLLEKYDADKKILNENINEFIKNMFLLTDMLQFNIDLVIEYKYVVDKHEVLNEAPKDIKKHKKTREIEG